MTSVASNNADSKQIGGVAKDGNTNTLYWKTFQGSAVTDWKYTAFTSAYVQTDVLYFDGTNNRIGVLNSAPAVALDVGGHIQRSGSNAVSAPSAGTYHVPGIAAVITAVGTANSGTAAPNLFAGASAVPALTTLNSLAGFAVPANSFRSGRVARMKLFGSYTTAGATSTITPTLNWNQAPSTTVVIGTGVASGTFNSAAGPFSFAIEILMTMIDATHMVSAGSCVLDGANPATTVSGSCSVLSAAAGAVVDPTTAANISLTWTFSTATSNTVQLLGGYLEFLN